MLLRLVSTIVIIIICKIPSTWSSLSDVIIIMIIGVVVANGTVAVVAAAAGTKIIPRVHFLLLQTIIGKGR